jgi:hypothetical protein
MDSLFTLTYSVGDCGLAAGLDPDASAAFGAANTADINAAVIAAIQGVLKAANPPLPAFVAPAPT